MKVLSIDPGKRHMGVCLVNEGGTIEHWELVDIPAFHPKDIVVLLNTLLHGLEYTDVVVEMQPGKNPSMKKLECWLHMYFAMKGVDCHQLHALKKLEYALESKPVKMSYYHRKKAAVTAVSKLVQSQPEVMRRLFDTSQKKDDLADSFLQALAFSSLRDARTPPKPKLPDPVEPKPECKKLLRAHVVHFLKNAVTLEEIRLCVKDLNSKQQAAFKKHFKNIDKFYKLKSDHLQDTLQEHAAVQGDSEADPGAHQPSV